MAETTPDPIIEALAAALHETEGTQHYIVHDVTNDGDISEVVACNGLPHDDDAGIVLDALRASGFDVVRVSVPDLPMTTPRDPDPLAELRRLAEAATPGPWKLREYRWGGGRWSDEATDSILIADFYGVGDDDSPANRDYIVAAVNALPRLLAVVEAARALVADWVGASTPSASAGASGVRTA